MNWLSKIRDRLRNRPDSEHGQAIVRIALVSVVLVYLVGSGQISTLHTEAGGDGAIALTAAYLLYSLANFGLILAFPGVSHIRRIVGVVADNAALTLCMILSHSFGAALFMIFLWVTLGNGFRYGRKYLYLSAGCSVVGFLAVVWSSDYWHDKHVLAGGLLFGMILIPAYVSGLLRRLEQTIVRARAASEAKGRFLANMSHEMRTPLNGVIGMAELLSSTRAVRRDSRAREIVGTIQASAETLLSIINDVLDLSKIEEGKMTVEVTDFDLHKLVKNVTNMTSMQVTDKPIRTLLDLSPETPFSLRGDPNHLRQVLLNLLSNAAKFTDQGEIRLAVMPVARVDGQVRIRFEVTDTGVGIPADAQEKLFEAFTQADDSITRRFGGTGLGTTIARELVHAMGGDIGFESTEGVGTTFWFELPFEVESDAAPGPQAFLQSRRAVVLTSDDPLSLALREALTTWGLEILWASTAGELLDLLETERDLGARDLLLIDRRGLSIMPEDLCRTIQAQLSDRCPHCILLTPATDHHTQHDYLLAGFDVVVELPFDKTVLFNALHASVPDDIGNNDFLSHYRARHQATGLRILAADDNAVNRQVLEAFLTDVGHQVTLVGDGDTAFDHLSREDYDLAILDMQMPGMSGLEVTQMLRFSEPAGTRLPILMLSANATPQAREEAHEAGADAFLTKPFRAAQLFQEIDLLTGNGAGQESEAGTADTAAPLPREQKPPENILDDYIVGQLLALQRGPEFLQRLADSFAREADAAVAQMRAALEANDIAAFSDAAHALKGNAANVGGVWLAEYCNRAQHLSLEELPAEGPPCLEKIEAGSKAVTAALRARFARQSSATAPG